MAAMGVSTQGAPFKTYCSPLWLCPTFRRASHSYSIRSCEKRSPDDPPFKVKNGSTFTTRPFAKEFEVHDETRSFRTSSPQIFATCRNQLVSGKDLQPVLSNGQMIDEENVHSFKPYPSDYFVRERGIIPLCEASQFSYVSGTTTTTPLPRLGTHSHWKEEIQNVKRSKINSQSTASMSLEIPKDGSMLREKDELEDIPHTSPYDSRSNNKGSTRVLSDLLRYSSQSKLKPRIPACRTIGPTSPVRKDNSIPVSNNSYYFRPKLNNTDDLQWQNGLPPIEIARAGIQTSTSLDRRVDESKVKHFELVEFGVNNATAGVYPDDGSLVLGLQGETSVEEICHTRESTVHVSDHRKRLIHIYDEVLVVDNISIAKSVVKKLTKQYNHLVHACDTEVAKIDVKDETPVDHGEVICFSIYSGPEVDFDGKTCIWVDVLDGGKDVLMAFAPFFEDPSIRKVWHNYSFDNHVLENYGFKVSGFYADTMHLARLWDSSRRTEGGYSLEALTGDSKVMSGCHSRDNGELNSGKISMKSIFGKKKVKKDGTEGKIITIIPVEELQREERIPWICYSALDSMSTLQLFESLKAKLEAMPWDLDGENRGSMYDFYEEYWRPFGELLVSMESEGMLVNRSYLAEIEKVATLEQKIAAQRFRTWASKYCPEAMHMNVGSDAQLRQLFFGGIMNRKDPNESLPEAKTFKVPNIDKVIEEGKKVPSKYRTITLHNLGVEMQAEIFTATGWPSVSGDALKILAGKVSAEQCALTDDTDVSSEGGEDVDPNSCSDDIDTSAYGSAYKAFGEGREGREACHAIAALIEICSIDSLISNFILPLQGSCISGKNGRIHCSLNINTETGRLSARRPNLQNQPALEKDRYKIRQAFVAAPGNSLIVADYGQLELRILAHLANCKSMLDAFRAGGDFHSRTAMNMYPHIHEAVHKKRVLLEWYPKPGEEKPPVPLLKDAFASERRKAKMLNFSIAYGKTPVGLSRDWKVSVKEAKETVKLWYKERQEVLRWQQERKKEAEERQCVHTLLGRARRFPSVANVSNAHRGHIERAAINAPVQGSAADVAMCAMLEISRNSHLKELGWKLLLQVHDEVILEGPTESAEVAKAIVVECMSKPFYGTNFLKVDLSVDAKCAQSWYAAK